MGDSLSHLDDLLIEDITWWLMTIHTHSFSTYKKTRKNDVNITSTLSMIFS